MLLLPKSTFIYPNTIQYNNGGKYKALLFSSGLSHECSFVEDQNRIPGL